MGKAQKETSCPKKPRYLTPNFDPKEIITKAIAEFTPPIYPFEAENRDFFESRKKAEKAAINGLFAGWLSDFAGLWDESEAFEKSVKIVLEKWHGLLFHHEASVGFSKTREEVARSVFQGIGFKGDGNLGGNPFLDVAVAVACIAKQNAAFEAFEFLYREKLTQKAIAWANKVKNRTSALLQVDAFKDWFSDFQTRILTDGMLDGYGGKCGLVNYLAPILAQYLGRIACKAFRLRSSVNIDASAGKDGGYNPADESSNNEFEDGEDAAVTQPKACKAIVEALTSITDIRRRVLRLRVGSEDSDGLPNKEVAQICEISPQQASAYYGEARDEIGAAIARLYDPDTREEIFQYMRQTGAVDLVKCLSQVDPNTGKLNSN